MSKKNKGTKRFTDFTLMDLLKWLNNRMQELRQKAYRFDPDLDATLRLFLRFVCLYLAFRAVRAVFFYLIPSVAALLYMNFTIEFHLSEVLIALVGSILAYFAVLVLWKSLVGCYRRADFPLDFDLILLDLERASFFRYRHEELGPVGNFVNSILASLDPWLDSLYFRGRCFYLAYKRWFRRSLPKLVAQWNNSIFVSIFVKLKIPLKILFFILVAFYSLVVCFEFSKRFKLRMVFSCFLVLFSYILYCLVWYLLLYLEFVRWACLYPDVYLQWMKWINSFRVFTKNY